MILIVTTDFFTSLSFTAKIPKYIKFKFKLWRF